MIVDTSALTAITYRERDYGQIRDALLSEKGFIPSPVIVEFERVVSLDRNQSNPVAIALLREALAGEIHIRAFEADMAQLAAAANDSYGSGNERGGKLNMLDLMVYGMAKALALPILCTGNDFRATDAAIHPASRIG